MDNQGLIDTLFMIYDTKEQNYIEKRDLIKLLYNYPNRDVFELIRESIELSKLTIQEALNDNIDTKYKMMISRTPQPSTTKQKVRSEVPFNINDSIQKEDNLLNFTEIVNKKDNLGYKNKTNSLGLTAQPFRPHPTSVDNKIKLIADLIYLRYGKNGKLELEEFSQWMKLHKTFLNSFREWFKQDIWSEYYDEATNRYLPSFFKKKPEIEGFVKTQRFKTYKKVNVYCKLYGKFFMLFKNIKDIIPFRVIILRLLDISYNYKKNKILIEHQCAKYDKIKIILPNETTFKLWKQVFDEFTTDIVTRKYKWQDGEIIGVGKFSKVYRVSDRETNKFYALKIINKKKLLDEEKAILFNEANIMNVLNHKNIIKLYQSIENYEYYFYVLELVNGKDLYRYVSNRKFLDEYEASWIMKNLFEAVDYIHMTGIVHRDLKPENIMLEFNAKSEIIKVKIIDFGLSCFSEDVKAMKARCGTLNYTAPEILTSVPYDNKIDVFSLGVIMYFMIRGNLPFYSDDKYITAKKTIDGDYEMDNDDFFINVSSGCKELIKAMLEIDPKKRINIFQAMTSDWILKGETLKKYQNINREEFNLNKFI